MQTIHFMFLQKVIVIGKISLNKKATNLFSCRLNNEGVQALSKRISQLKIARLLYACNSYFSCICLAGRRLNLFKKRKKGFQRKKKGVVEKSRSKNRIKRHHITHKTLYEVHPEDHLLALLHQRVVVVVHRRRPSRGHRGQKSVPGRTCCLQLLKVWN